MTKRFLVKVWNQIYRDNRDCIIAVCGGTGSGKSTIALALAELLDLNHNTGLTRFNINRVVFGFDEWLNVLKENHPHGTAIVMEEPQAYFNSRTFSSRTNLDAIAKFSTGRVFQYLYILTYPSFERIDSQLRERIHFMIQTESIDKKNKLNVWQPRLIIENWKPNQPVFKSRISYDVNGYQFALRCKTGMPSLGLYTDYKRKSMEWKYLIKTGKINSSGNLIKEKEPVLPVRDFALDIIEKNGLKPGMTISDVMGLTGLSYNRSYQVYARLKVAKDSLELIK